jgi:hypothetical protein
VTDVDDRPVYRCHTTARRHQNVTGTMGGHVLPWTFTDVQLIVCPTILIGLLFFRSRWGPYLPLPLQIIVVLGLPFAAYMGLRFWQPEDRSPLRYLLGVVSHTLAPTHGRVNGRTVRLGTTTTVGGRFFCSGR